MKTNLKNVILALLLLLTGQAYAQEKNNANVDLAIGVSMPELYHFGLRYHYIRNARLDFDFGSDFNDDDNGILYSVTINHALYLGKPSPRANRKLWSVNTGFSFSMERTTLEKSTTGCINLFLAREFPITKKIFIQPEIGASYFLLDQIVKEGNILSDGDKIGDIIPKLGLNLILNL